MPPRRLPYVQREIAKGKVFWYFRRQRAGPRVRLPDDYGSEAFLAAYHAALAGQAPALETGPGKASKGTLAWLAQQYRASAKFAALAPSTRRVRDRIMQGICEHVGRDGSRGGDTPIERISRATLQAGMDRRASKPEAANTFLKVMRNLLAHAESLDLITENPARKLRLLPGSTDGFYTWTREDIAKFEAHHPVGTKARLAMDIMLYSGLRKSDVVMIGRQHIRDGVITIRPTKTARTSGVVVTIHVHPRLAASIAAAPVGDLHLLVTEFKKPFTANGFGNWFRSRCNEAGVPGSAHGLRKAGASRLAEDGATTSQLMAFYGWTSSKEADRYTRSADRKKLGLSLTDPAVRDAAEKTQ